MTHGGAESAVTALVVVRPKLCPEPSAAPACGSWASLLHSLCMYTPGHTHVQSRVGTHAVHMPCTVTQCPTEARWLGWRGAAGAAAVQPDGYARARARSAPSLPHPDDYEVQHLNSKDTPLFKRRKCVACVYTKAIFKSWKHLSIPLKQSDEFHAAMSRELSSRNTGAVFPVFPDICQLYDH